MSEDKRITPEHPLHKRLLERHKLDGGGMVFLNGKTWMPIQDNEDLVFVQTQAQSEFGNTYEKSSFGK